MSKSPVAFVYVMVLSVLPLIVIPAPSASASEGLAVAANSMFLSSTDTVVELIVVVAPFTVKFPDSIILAPEIVPVNAGLAVGAPPY